MRSQQRRDRPENQREDGQGHLPLLKAPEGGGLAVRIAVEEGDLYLTPNISIFNQSQRFDHSGRNEIWREPFPPAL